MPAKEHASIPLKLLTCSMKFPFLKRFLWLQDAVKEKGTLNHAVINIHGPQVREELLKHIPQVEELAACILVVRTPKHNS